MKIVILSLLMTSFGVNAYAQGFNILGDSFLQGGTIAARLTPQWQGPMVCISAFNKHYTPSVTGDVFIGIAADTNPGKYILNLVECGRGVRLNSISIEVEITRNNYQKTRTAGRGRSIRPRRGPEAVAIQNAFSAINSSMPDLTNESAFKDPVVYPIGNLSLREMSDPYGLIYRNNAKRLHNGVDLRMPVGTPIMSTNKGKVVLVANNYSKEGNMVIINHGRSIFSVYMHLSRINVAMGEDVEGGQIIGLSGATGAGVREPHLHFCIKINGIYIDPLNFIDTVDTHMYLTR